MKTNEELTEEYFSIINSFDGDIKGRRDANDYMEKSSAIVHHEVVATTFIPRLYNRRTYEIMNKTVELTHGILLKVMKHYLQDPTYRKIFSYDPRLVDLILLPRGYDALLPFARFDVFINEETYEITFCEFNADGSSGMNENREITNSIRNSRSFQEFSKRHSLRDCELFDSWVDEFISIYSTYKHQVDSPRFAICDYLDHGVVDEFFYFAKLFEKRGFPCSVCDVRDLVFDKNVLKDKDGNRIDAIWRRCVTNDVIEFWDESQDMLEAVRQEKVALIGSFAGHIVHDKQIFEALCKPQTQTFLNKEEVAFIEKTIPQTRLLDSRFINLEEIKKHKDQWIIKPIDAYGAADVFAGCLETEDDWCAHIETFANAACGAPFLVQRYITPYKTHVLESDRSIASLRDEEVDLSGKWYNNLQGLYCYNGTFQGVFSRLGPYPTISKPMKGITAATIWVDD